jgi:hypothetical protein
MAHVFIWTAMSAAVFLGAGCAESMTLRQRVPLPFVEDAVREPVVLAAMHGMLSDVCLFLSADGFLDYVEPSLPLLSRKRRYAIRKTAQMFPIVRPMNLTHCDLEG